MREGEEEERGRRKGGRREGEEGRRTKSRARETELLLDQPRVSEDVGSVDLDTLDGGEGSSVRKEDSRLGELSNDLPIPTTTVDGRSDQLICQGWCKGREWKHGRGSTNGRKELMRNAEDDEGGVLDDVDEVRDGDEVLRQVDVGKVSVVLVLLVHDLGELALSRDLQHDAARQTMERKRHQHEASLEDEELKSDEVVQGRKETYLSLSNPHVDLLLEALLGGGVDGGDSSEGGSPRARTDDGDPVDDASWTLQDVQTRREGESQLSVLIWYLSGAEEDRKEKETRRNRKRGSTKQVGPLEALPSWQMDWREG
jgi:hypothetical protein